MKKCNQCNLEKDLTNFRIRKEQNNLRKECIECMSKRDKERYKRKRIEIINKTKEYKKNNRKKYNENFNIRYKEDINFRLTNKLRTRFRKALKRNSKRGSAVRDLGCSIDKFKLWMEMHWEDGMSWDNYGNGGWHIDHIVPLSKFDLNNKIELLKSIHFSNLQPLWEKDNLSKGDKLEWTKD